MPCKKPSLTQKCSNKPCVQFSCSNSPPLLLSSRHITANTFIFDTARFPTIPLAVFVFYLKAATCSFKEKMLSIELFSLQICLNLLLPAKQTTLAVFPWPLKLNSSLCSRLPQFNISSYYSCISCLLLCWDHAQPNGWEKLCFLFCQAYITLSICPSHHFPGKCNMSLPLLCIFSLSTGGIWVMEVLWWIFWFLLYSSEVCTTAAAKCTLFPL